MKHQHLIKSAAYYSLANYVLMPLGILSSILVRRWLDPYIYGVIATLNLFVMYSIFSNLGVLSAAEVRLPFLRGKGHSRQIARVRSASYSFMLITSILFSVGVFVWAVMTRDELDPYLFQGLIVYSLYFLFNQVAAYYVTLLRSNGEFVFLSKYQVFSGLLVVVGNPFAVWLAGFKGFLAIAILGVAFQVFLLYRYMRYIPIFRIRASEIKELLLTGIPMLIMGLTAQGMKTVDNLLVLKILDTKQLGYFTIALMANTLIFSVTNSIGTVLFPSMQEAFGRSGSAQAMTSYIVRPSIIIGLFLPLIMGGIYFLVPPIIHQVIPKFIPGIAAFKVVVMTTYFFAMTNMATGYLISVEKKKVIILVNVATLIFITGLAIVVSRFNGGLVGIAIVTGVGYLANFLAFSVYVLRHWESWKGTLVFLKDTSVPFFFSLLLILAIEKYDAYSSIGIEQHFASAVCTVFVYTFLYSPCLFLFEKKARIFSDIVIPLFRKIVRS